MSIGTVTTLAPTEPATASITGTAEEPVLNLGIPKGDTGEVSQAELDAVEDAVADLKSDLLSYINGSSKTITLASGSQKIPMLLLKGVTYTFTNNRSSGCTLGYYKADGTGNDTNISGGINANKSVSFTPDADDWVGLRTWCGNAGTVTITSNYSDLDAGQRFLELEPKADILITNFANDVHPSLELGGITISSAGWGYFEDTRRVRTKQGEVIPLNTGDTIGLTSYSGTRYYLGWRKSDGTYGSDGWLTADFTVQESGEYIVLIANNPDAEQSDTSALGNLLKITHYSTTGDFVKSDETKKIAGELDAYLNYNVKSINHRGFNSIAPENTLIAYKLSRENGFVYVETDVDYTSDGVLVLIHDSTINRTARNADGTAISQTIAIEDITYEQALTYDFGIYKGASYAGTKIPTFEQFVSLCRNIGVHPYIELKFDDSDKIQDCIDIVKKYGMLDKVTWIATVPDALHHLKVALPNARLGYVVSSITSAVISNALSLQTGTNEVFIDSLSCTDAECQLCIDANIPLEVWTYNQVSEILAMNPYISGITSDTLVASRVLYDNSIE